MNLIEKLAEITEWNKKKFPDATLGSQLLKLEEEIKEFKDACYGKGNRLEEMADVYIALGGLRRFGSEIGEFILQSFPLLLTTDEIENLIPEIDKKMKVNKTRVFKKMPDGTEHH